MGIMDLPVFPPAHGIPEDSVDISLVLHSPLVKEIRCFALGPEGTNMVQACRRWISRMGIGVKANIALCETPESSIRAARAVAGKNVLCVFWTCAVFDREFDIFFGNPGSYPFFSQEIMDLDEMQLATREELVKAWTHDRFPATWKVSTHPSPSVLLRQLHCEAVLVRSNAEAAIVCAKGETEGCITTESARAIHGLIKIHSFGSPRMVFFVGITEEGAELVREVYAGIRHRPERTCSMAK